MPAGIKYDLKPIPTLAEAARFETCYRLSGGFNLDDDKLVQGTYLPSLAPIAVDFTTRKVKAVKNVVVVDVFATGGTFLKIKKGSLICVDMHIGNGYKGATISAINKSNAEYDMLTITALDANVAIGAVLFEASAAGGTAPKHKANFLNYAATKVEPGASVTAIGQIFEIQKSKLQTPISTKDEESLGARFMFV